MKNSQKLNICLCITVANKLSLIVIFRLIIIINIIIYVIIVKREQTNYLIITRNALC